MNVFVKPVFPVRASSALVSQVPFARLRPRANPNGAPMECLAMHGIQIQTAAAHPVVFEIHLGAITHGVCSPRRATEHLFHLSALERRVVSEKLLSRGRRVSRSFLSTSECIRVYIVQSYCSVLKEAPLHTQRWRLLI